MAWQDAFFSSYETILSNGAAVTQRQRLNFIGATVLDNPTTLATDITIAGGGATFGGDLASVTGTTQKVTGFQQTPLDSSMIGPADGSWITKASGAWAAISTAAATVALIGASVGNTPTTGQVLIATGTTTATWQALPAGGITQLTGAVTAGPGSGSQVATITPGTAGQVFISSATPTATWTSLISVELTHGRFTAGGSGSDFKTVIGPLVSSETSFGAVYFLAGATAPSGANPAFYGDGNATWVASMQSTSGVFFWQLNGGNIATLQTGSFNLLTQSAINFAAGIASPTFTQAGVGSDIATNNLILAPQAPFASASTNRHPGQVEVRVPTPIGSNDFYGGLLVTAASGPTPLVSIGHYAGPDTTYGAIYFGGSAGSPNGSNFAFLGSAVVTYLNAPSSGGSINLAFDGSAGNGVNVTNTSIQFQTSLVTMQWVAGAASPKIKQIIQASDIATNNLVLAPQAPFASATGTHRDPGQIQFDIPTPVSGSTFNGGIVVTSGGHELSRIGMYGGDPTSGFGGLWFGASPTASNYAFVGDGATKTAVNSPSVVLLQIAGTYNVMQLAANGGLGYRTTSIGSWAFNLVSKGTNYTLNSAGNQDFDVWITAPGTYTLPTPYPGAFFRIIVAYDPTAGGGTIARAGGEKINGATASLTLGATDAFVILIVSSNGTDWVIGKASKAP